MRSSLAVAALLLPLGCAQIVGADFDDLRPRDEAVGGASGSAAGGTGGGNAGAPAVSRGGQGGDPAAGGGGAPGKGGVGGASGGSLLGNGGNGASGGAGAGGGVTAGAGGSGTAVPPRVCGDMTGLDEDSPWPMDGGCPTRISRAAGALLPLSATSTLTYAADTEGESIVGSPVVDGQGNVYVSTSRIGPEGAIAVVHAYGDKGGPLWELVFKSELAGPLLLTRFGGIPSVLVTTSFQLRLVSRDGKDVIGGVASPGAFITGSPVVSGGVVFFASADGKLHAWRPETMGPDVAHATYDDGSPDAALLSPAVAPDGTVYFVKMLANQTGGFLLALTTTSAPLGLKKKWSAPFKGSVIGGRLAVAGDGTIVFATTKAILGFTAAGDAAFSVPAVVGESLPAILGDRVFHAGSNGTLLAISTKGTVAYESPAGYGSSFLISDEGAVTFLGLAPQQVNVLDGRTGSTLASVMVPISSVQGGRVSIDLSGRPLFAIGSHVYGVSD